MRIILKILAAPFVVALTLLWAVMVFVFSWAETVLHYVSGLSLLASVALFIMGQTTGGIVFAVIAFLISPVGIPAIAGVLIDMLDSLNCVLKDFITA
jgi:hypothetical protein